MNLHKGPLINLFLLLLLMHFFIKKQIEWKKLLIVVSVALIFLMTMYLSYMEHNEGVERVLFGIFHRASIGSISDLFWYQLYIEQHGLLYGVTMVNPAHIFPFEHVNISVAVQDFANVHLREQNIVGSAPVVFFVEWFVNFGWAVAIISMFLFGLFLFILDFIMIKQIMKKGKNVILLVIYIYMMFYFQKYAITSISDIMLDNYLWSTVLTGLLLWKISKMYDKKQGI